MPQIKKLLPIIFFGIILGLIVFKIEPPKNFTNISFYQAVLFFIPLFLFLFLLINLVLRFLVWSAVLSLGIILLLILQALGFLNPFTLILTLLTVALFLKFFKRPRNFSLRKLSYSAKNPRLIKLKRQK